MTDNAPIEIAETGKAGSLIVKRFLLGEGENLFITANPFVAEDRFDEFIEATGLSESDTVLSPLVSLPVPVNTGPTGEPLAKSSPGLRTEVLWHPFFWLPDSSLRPQLVDDEDGSSRPESQDEMAVRVCLELGASGLYDPKTGCFVDVLALYGLDIDDEETFTQIESWLMGVDDPALDAIDLTSLLLLDKDPKWSLNESQRLMPYLEPAMWNIVCNDLLEMLSDIGNFGDGEDRSMDEMRSITSAIFDRALALLENVDLGPTAQSPTDFWTIMKENVESYEGDDMEDFFTSVAADGGKWLEAAANTYSDAPDRLDAAITDTAGRLPETGSAGR